MRCIAREQNMRSASGPMLPVANKTLGTAGVGSFDNEGNLEGRCLVSFTLAPLVAKHRNFEVKQGLEEPTQA